MRKFILVVLAVLFSVGIEAQSCEEMMDFVKSKSYGSTYSSYNSNAISRVTFYSVYVYKTYYFAIVCFKRKY